MHSLTYHRSSRSAVTALAIAIALAMVVVSLIYVGRLAEAQPEATQPPPWCVGTYISPGDDLDRIINADPVGTATTFCIKPGTYSPDNIVNLNEGDALIGPEGELVSRGPATYPGSLSVNIRNGASLKRIIHTTGTVTMKWLDIAGGVGVTGNAGTGLGISAGNADPDSEFAYLRVHDNHAVGISGSNGVIRNSEFYRNGLNASFIGFTASAMKGVDEYEATENYVHDNPGIGVWCDGGCDNQPSHPNGFWVHDNLLVNNGGQGARFEHAPKGLANGGHVTQPSALIENNEIHGNDWSGVSVHDAQNGLIRSNNFGPATIAGVSYGANTARGSTSRVAIQFTDSGRTDRTDLWNGDAINNELNGEDIRGCEKPDQVVYCAGNG